MESGEPEFQIAPMIDVLLVLMIFFMSITSAQVLEIDKDIQLPVALDAKKKEDKNAMLEAALNVRWLASEQRALFKLNSDELPEEEIVSRLTSLKASNPTYRVVIRGDKDVPAVQIQKAMTIIGQSGIDGISFSALNQE